MIASLEEFTRLLWFVPSQFQTGPETGAQEMKFIIIGIIFALLTLANPASDRSVIVQDRYGNIIRTQEYERYGGKTIRDREWNIVGTEDID
jgi:hypothetical protein